jgi:uncharacterized protein YutE (UPF0331/DUF86 family)
MVISELNVERIKKHLGLIQEYIEELKELSLLSEEEFLSDKRNFAASESYLRRAIESIFDIGRHILAKTYGSKEIEYKKIAIELGKKGVIKDKNYTETVLLKIAGYRNRLVHMYYEVTPKELYDIAKNHLSDLDRFIKEIVAFLDKYLKNKQSTNSR